MTKSKHSKKGLFSPWCPKCEKYKGRYAQCPHCGYNEKTDKIEPIEEKIVRPPIEPNSPGHERQTKGTSNKKLYIVLIVIGIILVGVISYKTYSNALQSSVNSQDYETDTILPKTNPPTTTSTSTTLPTTTTTTTSTSTTSTIATTPPPTSICEWIDPFYYIEWGVWGAEKYENVDVIITNEEDQTITVKLIIGFFAGGNILSDGLEIDRITKTITLNPKERKTVNYQWNVERNVYFDGTAIIIDERADRIEKCE